MNGKIFIIKLVKHIYGNFIYNILNTFLFVMYISMGLIFAEVYILYIYIFLSGYYD